MILTSHQRTFQHYQEIPFYAHATQLRLAHIRRLTNPVGIAQHAKCATPDYNHGYCLDDNSRALMLAGLSNRVYPHSCDKLIDTYLAFIHYMQRDNGQFGNF